MSTLTPFEQATCRAYGSPMGCLVAGCGFDAEHLKKSMRYVSHFTVHGTAYHMDTTRRGIELRTDAEPTVIRWQDITAHIRSLPLWQSDQAKGLCRMKHSADADVRLVMGLTADVLHKAFPDADQPTGLDLFTAMGVSA